MDIEDVYNCLNLKKKIIFFINENSSSCTKVFEKYCRWNVLSVLYPIYEMCCLSNIQSMKCAVCLISNLWNVLSVLYPIYEMCRLSYIQSMKCAVCLISNLWNVNEVVFFLTNSDLNLKYSMLRLDCKDRIRKLCFW